MNVYFFIFFFIAAEAAQFRISDDTVLTFECITTSFVPVLSQPIVSPVLSPSAIVSPILSQPIVSPVLSQPIVSNWLTNVLTETKFKQMFPKADEGVRDEDRPYFTHNALIQASRMFPEFLSDSNDKVNRRELAAFLANAAHETNGGWDTAPGGRESWGFYFNSEVPCLTLPGGCPGYGSIYATCIAEPWKSMYPCAQCNDAKCQYFGRGPMQLTYNYNYGLASQSIFKDNRLLEQPNLVSGNGTMGFITSLWFWMTPQYNKPSCHDAITSCLDNWNNSKLCGGKQIQPRLPGFGLTINIINGGVECGGASAHAKVNSRIRYYRHFARLLGLSVEDLGPDTTLSCAGQPTF
jgi:chitinase